MDFLNKILEQNSDGDLDILKEIERQLEAKQTKRNRGANETGAPPRAQGQVYRHPTSSAQEFEDPTCVTDKKPVSRSRPKPQKAGKQKKSEAAPREEFSAPTCATANSRQAKVGETADLASWSPSLSLIDDLKGRLGEAVLLTEILGRPMCERY